MPKWARAIVESIGPLAGDPSTSHRTRSHTTGSSLISHVICDDPQTFASMIGHLEWENSMEEEYSSLIKNHTWELCPLPTGRKLVQ